MYKKRDNLIKAEQLRKRINNNIEKLLSQDDNIDSTQSYKFQIGDEVEINFLNGDTEYGKVIDVSIPLGSKYGFTVEFPLGGAVKFRNHFNLNQLKLIGKSIKSKSSICKHEWVKVGTSLYGKDWINCKHCDLAKEEYNSQSNGDKFSNESIDKVMEKIISDPFNEWVTDYGIDGCDNKK